jgi:hypothetical protein
VKQYHRRNSGKSPNLARAQLKFGHETIAFRGNDAGVVSLLGVAQTREFAMIGLSVDRALNIYGAIADRSETRDVRERLSKYLIQRYVEGERNEHRLTVEGLSYLQRFYREIDSRN